MEYVRRERQRAEEGRWRAEADRQAEVDRQAEIGRPRAEARRLEAEERRQECQWAEEESQRRRRQEERERTRQENLEREREMQALVGQDNMAVEREARSANERRSRTHQSMVAYPPADDDRYNALGSLEALKRRNEDLLMEYGERILNGSKMEPQ